MITSYYNVDKRELTKLKDTNYVGKHNVDTFKFIFSDEWKNLNKTLKIIVGENIYDIALVNDEALIPDEAYDSSMFTMGIIGTKINQDETFEVVLDTIPIKVNVRKGVYVEGEIPDNMPTPTQWDLWIAEFNRILQASNTNLEDAQAILEQLETDYNTYIAEFNQIKSDTQEIKEDTQAIKEEVEELKQDTSDLKDDVQELKEAVEEEIQDFNTDYTQKKQAIDEEISNFEDDYEEKMSNLNSAGTAQVNAINTAGSTQVGNVNTAGTTQVGNVNSAGATQKTNVEGAGQSALSDISSALNSAVGNINHVGNTQKSAVETAGSTQVSAVNTAGNTQVSAVEGAGTTQVGNVNQAGSTQVSAVNSAGTQQTSAVNSAGATQVANVNSAGTTQTNAVNTAGQQKLDEINSNQTVQQVNDHEIRITRLEKASHIYGVKRARHNNSSSAWERTDDAVGLIANAQIGTTPVRNDFDNIKPWSNIIRKNIDMTTKNTTAYYGEAEFKLDGSNGDVYVEYPDIYLKKWQDEDYDYVQMADGPMEGFTKIKSFDVQAYLTGYVGGKLRSYSGLAPARSTSIGTYRTRAEALGENFCLLDWRYFVMQLVYLVEYADYNSQAKLGRGIVSMRDNDADKALIAESNTNRIIISTNGTGNFIVGQTISIGNTAKETFQVAESRTITAINNYDDGTITGVEIVFDGAPVNIAVNNVIWSSGQISGGGDFLGMKSGCYADDGKHAQNYRGVENMSGNLFAFVDGINIKNGQVYICYDPTEYVSDKFTDPYEAIGYVNAYSGNDNYNGYAKTLGYDANHPLISMPTELGGSSSTYMTDNYYISTGNRVARVGGHLSFGAGAGLWCRGLSSTSSYAAWNYGARVLKYQT